MFLTAVLVVEATVSQSIERDNLSRRISSKKTTTLISVFDFYASSSARKGILSVMNSSEPLNASKELSYPV